MKKKNNGKHKQFLHVIMIQSNSKYLFATSVKCSDYKTSPFYHKLAETYPFRGRGFHTPVEWKIGYKVINKQVIIQILILNTAFYIYGNSEHSLRRTLRVANEVSSTVENMIKEK